MSYVIVRVRTRVIVRVRTRVVVMVRTRAGYLMSKLVSPV